MRVQCRESPSLLPLSLKHKCMHAHTRTRAKQEALEVRKAAAAAGKAGEGTGTIPASEAEEDWEAEEGLEGEGVEGVDEEQEAIVDMMYTLASTYAKVSEFGGGVCM